MHRVVLIAVSTLTVFLGIITYILFQKTFININLDIFISSTPNEVFMFIKEPHNLPDIHHRTKSAHLTRLVTDPDGTEHREYTATEDFRHIGPQVVSSRSSANPETLSIHLSSVSLYSLVRSHIVFNMKPYQSHNREGTLVTETLDIYIPYALKKFVNKTIYETHVNMLENLKFILERTYNVETELNNGFEHSSYLKDAFTPREEEEEEEEEKEEEEEEKVINEEYDEEDSWDLFHKG